MTTLMHCGAGAVSRNDLPMLPAPEPRGPSHHPIAHHDFVELIEQRVKHTNLDIVETQYFLNRGGDQLFGLYKLEPEHTSHQALVGFRNSHDMSFSAGLAMGTRVFVCDNMTFAGEILLRRKHTARIMEELPDLIDAGLYKLRALGRTQEQRIEMYRNAPLETGHAAELLLEAHALKLVTSKNLQQVWNEHRNDPLRYDDHNWPSYWRFYNSITHSWKRSPAQFMGPIHDKSARLHNLLDMEIA